jgi:hypothetical protein
MHVNIYKTFTINMSTHFLTPLISKNDYDKPKLKNKLCNVKGEKLEKLL